MIRTVSGTLLRIAPFSAVVDVSGVGYLIHTPSVLDTLSVGTEASFHTHLAVRENALDLYGFLTTDELEMFELLIDLPKIGPKSAMAIMSQADVALLRKAALEGDASYLSKVSGIGKKSAEKIVIGLRDKFGAEDLLPGTNNESDSDVLDALLTLGYSQKESRDALQKLPPELEHTNDRIKAALKLLGR